MDGEFFDRAAATWDDDPAKVERAAAVAHRLAADLPLGPASRVLEYGAGTALVAQALAPHVGPITLAEPSEGMRSVIEAKVSAGALPAGTRAWPLDLAIDPAPDERFDVVVTVLVLHHVPDLAPVLAGFARLLDPGGRLAIVDLEEEDGSFHAGHGAGSLHVHHGFARSALAEQLGAAGFSEVAFDHVHDMEKDGRTYPLFLATAIR